MPTTSSFHALQRPTKRLPCVGRWCGLLLMAAMVLAPAGLRAQDGELPALEYDRLRSRLDELEAEVSHLKSSPTKPSAFADDPNSVQRVNSESLPPAPGYFPEAGVMSMQAAAGTPVAPAKPKYPSVTVNGFFQADSLWFGQDSENRASLVNPAAVPPFNGDLQV